jgi:hypothetical protein
MTTFSGEFYLAILVSGFHGGKSNCYVTFVKALFVYSRCTIFLVVECCGSDFIFFVLFLFLFFAIYYDYFYFFFFFVFFFCFTTEKKMENKTS